MKFNTAKINSISGEFESYEIKNVVGITYGNNELILTYVDKATNEIHTTVFNDKDIYINIA